jgi:hypothetical protein
VRAEGEFTPIWRWTAQVWRFAAMRHVKAVTKLPAHADDLPINLLIDFITALLTAIKPILVAKFPSAT